MKVHDRRACRNRGWFEGGAPPAAPSVIGQAELGKPRLEVSISSLTRNTFLMVFSITLFAAFLASSAVAFPAGLTASPWVYSWPPAGPP